MDQSYQGKLNMFPYDPRFRSIAPPSVGIFDEPTMSICFNVQWAGHIDGVLSRLLWTDAWAGEQATKEWAVSEITKLLVSMIARTPCGGGDCMGECCDDIVDRLEAIEALLAAQNKKSPAQVKEDVDAVQQSYEDYLGETDAIYDNDITNVHPDMAYGDSNDAARDQALCFITRRFVDIVCDWVITNINLKVANQQTALNIAAVIGGGADLLSRFFAETAFGAMFQNIDKILELEVAAMTAWITSVTSGQLSVFQDTDAREELACAWYEQMRGYTPTADSFISSLNNADVTDNAAIIRDKIAAALVPVTSAQAPDPEHVFFIFSDLWQQAYDGVQSGIVDDCGCIDPANCFNFRAGLDNWIAYGAGAAHRQAGKGFYQANGGAMSIISLEGAIPAEVTSVRLQFDRAWAGQTANPDYDKFYCGITSTAGDAGPVTFPGSPLFLTMGKEVTIPAPAGKHWSGQLIVSIIGGGGNWPQTGDNPAPAQWLAGLCLNV